MCLKVNMFQREACVTVVNLMTASVLTSSGCKHLLIMCMELLHVVLSFFMLQFLCFSLHLTFYL